ncbi:MAG: glycosyltransferase family 2 protein [Candidatus Bathycorpusculaceae bacterium]
MSVIIPTLNSEKFLKKCLTSLMMQNYKKIEVIVVDDGSTDFTVKIAESFNCKVIRNPRRGRAEAKNEGIKFSSGEYLFFVDSDMEITPNVISECVNIAENNDKIGGIVIPERSVGNSFWVKVRDFERDFYAGTVVESARFFRAKPVKEVGGFEEGLVFFEESTLQYKIQKKGYNRFLRANSVIIHHEENFSLAAWLKKKFTYGKTLQLYSYKYGDYSKMQARAGARLGLFFKNWRRFLRKPLLGLGVILLKSLEYSAVMFGSILKN